MSKVVRIKVPGRAMSKAEERATRVAARQTRKPMTIANCQFEFKCPKQWGELTDDGKLDSRFCDACERRVHLCVTNEELRARAKAGECVAFYRPRGLPRVRRSASLQPGPMERTLGLPRFHRQPDADDEESV